MNARQTLNIFVEQGIVDPTVVDDIVQEVSATGKTLCDVLVDYQAVTEEGYYQSIANAIGAEYVNLKDFTPPVGLVKMLPAGLAQLHRAFPLGFEDNILQVALIDPLNPQTVEDLRFAIGKDVHPVVAPIYQIEELIKKHYGSDAASLDSILAELGGGIQFGGEGKDLDIKEIENEANAAPIIRYVDLVLAQAIQDRASDIHFEPFETEFKIRYRVDGSLYEMSPPPRHLANPVISRLKVMSSLNIAERRVPQDGRIQTMIAGRQVDLRVSTLPTQFGESVVLRVLDRSTVKLELESLGMPDGIYNYLVNTIQLPNGIFIVTGPTGSGKTTTLYACLNKINTVDSKVLTAEDPVEYEIDGVMQVPVNLAAGLTFARALRTFLRQDPDIVMVGEIRDLETAQIGIQASLTGHLVLSTLHTNDAPSAVTRLVDMGIAPFLLASTLEAVLAQRLVRRICLSCKAAFAPTDALLRQLGLAPTKLPRRPFYSGAGCPACHHTGYQGRLGLFEFLRLTDPLREMIVQGVSLVQLRQKALGEGMTSLRVAGISAILAGETTVEEVIKYT